MNIEDKTGIIFGIIFFIVVNSLMLETTSCAFDDYEDCSDIPNSYGSVVFIGIFYFVLMGSITLIGVIIGWSIGRSIESSLYEIVEIANKKNKPRRR